MSEFSTIGGQLAVPLASTTNAHGVQVNAAATANQMGAWTQLVSADENQWGGAGLEICLYSIDSGPAEFLVNIGVGTGDTVTVIPALRYLLSPTTNGRVGVAYHVPVKVPAGVAVYAQCQASVASKYLYVAGSLFVGGFLSAPGLAQVVAIGADYAASRGTSLEVGGLNNWGSTVELDASTDIDFAGFFVGLGHDGVTSWTTQITRYQIGIGPALDEHWLYEFRVQYTAAEAMGPACSGFVPLQIPAGSRLVVRGMADIGSVSARTKDVIVYGVR